MSLLVVALLPVPTASGQDKITVVLRYDDYSTVSPTEIERRLFEALSRRSLALTVGVIPAVCEGEVRDIRPQRSLPLSEAKVEVLKAAAARGRIEIAIHGFTHQTRASSALPSELLGLGLEAQLQLLKSGRDIVDGAFGGHSRTFIPPWNSFDADTVIAAERCGFDVLSAGSPMVVETRSAIKFLPATCELEEVDDAVVAARKCGAKSPVVVALIHPYDFTEVDPQRGIFSFQEFESILDWIVDQPDLTSMTLCAAADRAGPLDSAQYARWRELRSARTMHLVPPSLRSELLFYPIAPEIDSLASAHRWMLWVWYGGLSGLSIVGGVALSCVARSWLRLRTLHHLACAAAVLLSAGCVLLPVNVGWKKATASILLGGAGVGASLAGAYGVSRRVSAGG
jgi:hypothetical protein